MRECCRKGRCCEPSNGETSASRMSIVSPWYSVTPYFKCFPSINSDNVAATESGDSVGRMDGWVGLTAEPWYVLRLVKHRPLSPRKGGSKDVCRSQRDSEAPSGAGRCAGERKGGGGDGVSASWAGSTERWLREARNLPGTGVRVSVQAPLHMGAAGHPGGMLLRSTRIRTGPSPAQGEGANARRGRLGLTSSERWGCGQASAWRLQKGKLERWANRIRWGGIWPPSV